MEKFPKPPKAFVDTRKDSGAFTAPVEETIGVTGIPSLNPAGEEATRVIAVRAQSMAQAALDAISSLKGEVEGSKVGQEEFIKTTVTAAVKTGVDAAVAPVLVTLGQQNGEMLSQRVTLSKISRAVTALLTDEQSQAVKKLELAERAASISSHEINTEAKREELKISWVKKYSAYIKFTLAVIALLGVLAGWAGYSNLAHPHGGVEERKP